MSVSRSRFGPAARPGYFRAGARLAAVAGALCFSASAALAAPVVVTAPFTASPGDFVTLQGSGFGAKPRLFFKVGDGAESEIPIAAGRDDIVSARIPQTAATGLYELRVYDNVSAYSAPTQINAPVLHHFDAPDIAPGLPVRIIGRNMAIGGGVPTVTLLDTATGAQLPATVSAQQRLYLVFIPPSSIIAGHSYKAIVSNGYGTTTTDAAVLGHAAGNDYFKIGQAWAFDYVTRDGAAYRGGAAGGDPKAQHVFNVKTSASLTTLAVGDGVVNDAKAIQGALDRASANGGGIVYLPAGVYFIGPTSLRLRPGVVLQGAGAGATTITYGPPDGSTAKIWGVVLPDRGDLTGVADLSLKNLDTLRRPVTNFSSNSLPITRFFIQRVNWDLGGGSPIYLAGDRIAVQKSTITQGINYTNGDATTGGAGPFYVGPVTNLRFADNKVSWATNQVAMNDVAGATIEGNVFTRSASDVVPAPAAVQASGMLKAVAKGDPVERVLGRQLSMQFGKNILLYGNTFGVSDGDIKYNLNDGETLLNESMERSDVGVVTSAADSSVSADGKCSGVCAWNYFDGSSVVFLVSGKGAGQWRHVTAKTNNTFTIDRPWDVKPAAGDRFALSVPSFENVIFAANTMSDNPTGVAFFSGMFLNTLVTNNAFNNNSGIYLDAKSWINNFRWTGPTFSAFKNVEIKNNVLTNSNGKSAAYIHVGVTLRYPSYVFGTALYGVEVRGNSVTAKPGTTPYLYPEGFQNVVMNQITSGLQYNGESMIDGTVFQNNGCLNCPTAFAISGATLGTVIWNNSVKTSPGVASVALSDTAMYYRPASETSMLTVYGHD